MYDNRIYLERVARREKQLRTYKNLLYMFFIAVCVSIIVIISIGFKNGGKKANASSGAEVIYESVIVEDGDTLCSLADRYYRSYSGTKDSFIAAICNINNINSDDIRAGEYIIIPLSSAYN
ncbi:MAG: LysM peptidoglycan-binding domain-containing protein [Lachnospiraceae bacterium]|nr:LysM peptidoglycan-binding domain-containing protein [Lachnospiraceae bacterium]